MCRRATWPLFTAEPCFVYPSFYEGFRIAPLEAMQCGVPVIVGDRTSLPEVVGDAGLTVNPFDERAIAEAIARVIDDAQLRGELKARGAKRARAFTWAETARRTLKVYEQVFQQQQGLAQAVSYENPVNRFEV
ncbi:MAG: glycosyltransferase [Pyrinomonadaceae bacterium]